MLLILLVADDETDRRTWVVLSKLAWGKVSVRIPKVLFSSYVSKAYLIKLTWLVPLKACTKLEGSSVVMVGKTSC